MASTGYTNRKRGPRPKGKGGKRSWTTFAESEVDTEKGTNADNEAAAKKLAIRQPFESALNLQSDILLLWVGSPPQLSTIHTSLLAPKTLSILATSTSQPYPRLPITFHTVPDTTHETFEIYRNFLYTGKLCTHDAHGDQDYADNGNDEAHEDREWVRLALAYFLGLKLGDEGSCNAVVGGVVEKMKESDRSPTGLATEVYAHTQQGDKLRALLVDLHVWKGLGTWILPPHDDANGPVYFRREVRSGVRNAGTAIQDPDIPLPWEVDLCKYHVYNDTAVCERNTTPVVAAEVEPDTGTSRKLRKITSSLPFRSVAAGGGQKASPRQKKSPKGWGA